MAASRGVPERRPARIFPQARSCRTAAWRPHRSFGETWWSRSSLFPSKKNAAASHVAVYMPVESRLEQAYALCLERHPSVVAYRTQAISIEIPGDERIGQIF